MTLAHTYNPVDGSLAERVNAYQEVHANYQSVKTSQIVMDDKEWSDRLGEVQEVDQADDIISASLKKATQAIDLSELSQIKQLGLMNDEQLKELVKIKRQQESQDKRQSSKTDQRTRTRQR